MDNSNNTHEFINIKIGSDGKFQREDIAVSVFHYNELIPEPKSNRNGMLTILTNCIFRGFNKFQSYCYYE